MIKPILERSLSEMANLLTKLAGMEGELQKLGETMLACWRRRGKVLIAGNGGSAADAMHFAEELCVRFAKNRGALAAIALCDPTVLTCAGNDYGFEQVFSRQVEALGNSGDLLIVMSTSGNSDNLVRAVTAARKLDLRTVSFIGKDGGKLKGMCDIELHVPCEATARVQEAHKVLFHVLCEWIDTKVE